MPKFNPLSEITLQEAEVIKTALISYQHKFSTGMEPDQLELLRDLLPKVEEYIETYQTGQHEEENE